MRLIKEVRDVGSGNPVSGAGVTVQTWPGGILIADAETDADGIAEVQAQGAPGAVRVRVSRGGQIYDEYSSNLQPTGLFDLDQYRTRLAALVSDGLVNKYGDVFAATVGSGIITLGSGGVVLDGILALFPDPTTLTVTDGDRAAVAVLNGDAVSLVEIAYSAIVDGTHVPLHRYTVTSGQVVPSTITSIHRLAGPRAGRKAIIGIDRADSGTTLSAGGEAIPDLSTSLTLEAGTYDIWARIRAVGAGYDGALAIDLGAGVGTYRSLNGDVKGSLTNREVRLAVAGPGAITIQGYRRRDTSASGTGWALQATYGPTFNALAMSSPSQVYINTATGQVFIADTGNDRLVILNSAGTYITSITSLTGITGVCLDASANVYTLSDGGTDMRLRQYNSSLVQQWSVDFGGNGGQAHITTDGTHVWVCDMAGHKVYKRLCSTGGAVSTFGSSGSGNGQFGSGSPFGIVNDGIYLYVTDPGNTRVQTFQMSTGAYIAQWVSLGDLRGLAVDGSGNLLTAKGTSDTVTRATKAGTPIDAIFQVNSRGIGVALGDELWISNATGGTIAKWDEATTPFPFAYNSALLTAIAIPR